MIGRFRPTTNLLKIFVALTISTSLLFVFYIPGYLDSGENTVNNENWTHMKFSVPGEPVEEESNSVRGITDVAKWTYSRRSESTSEPSIRTSWTNSSLNAMLGSNPCDLGNKSASSKCLMSQPTLVGQTEGRLGNQLFGYAALFAISHLKNRSAAMPSSMSNLISKYFDVSLATLHPTLDITSNWKVVELPDIPPSSLDGLDKHPYVKLKGYDHNWKYFDGLRSLTLQEFKFHPKIIQFSKQRLNEVRSSFSRDEKTKDAQIVGIHVRRGDYIPHSKVYKFHIPSVQFYYGAMKYFQDKYSNVIFAVVSDDSEWCLENLGGLNATFNIRVLSGIPDEVGGLDLAILTLSDHVIFGLGTFGFWGAYLQEGEVIYCSDCDCNQPCADGLGKCKDVFHPDWIGFSRNGNVTRKCTDPSRNRIGILRP